MNVFFCPYVTQTFLSVHQNRQEYLCYIKNYIALRFSSTRLPSLYNQALHH